MSKKEANFDVDNNVSVSPLYIDVIKEIADSFDGKINDEYNRQLFYEKVQQATREYVQISAMDSTDQ